MVPNNLEDPPYEQMDSNPFNIVSGELQSNLMANSNGLERISQLQEQLQKVDLKEPLKILNDQQSSSSSSSSNSSSNSSSISANSSQSSKSSSSSESLESFENSPKENSNISIQISMSSAKVFNYPIQDKIQQQEDNQILELPQNLIDSINPGFNSQKQLNKANKKSKQQPSYKIEKSLGNGCSAVVYLAKEFSQNSQSYKDDFVAIKKFRKNKASHFQCEKKMLQIVSQELHPNILKLIKINSQEMEIQSHYYCNGNLLNTVQKKKGLKESQARFLFKGICNALLHLKSKNICHRDLKLENVLLDQSFNPILIDFGFAAFNQLSFGESIGTKGYQAPELVQKQSYSGYSADNFSLGVMLFEMVMGLPPFNEAKLDSGLYQKFALRNDEYWEAFKKYHEPSEQVKELINLLLSPDPASRPTLEQIFLMPWMSESHECERLSA